MKTFTARPMEHSDNLTRRACRQTKIGERFAMITDSGKTIWIRVRGGCERVQEVK